MMKHEDAVAQASSANFESGPVGRKWILPIMPGSVVVRQRRIGGMLAVIEDDLEHPLRGLSLRRSQQRWPTPAGVKQRFAVAVKNSLWIAVHCTARVVALAAVPLM